MKINAELDQLQDQMTDQTFYNSDKLQDNGWCEIVGAHGQNIKWGICSSSCKLVYIRCVDICFNSNLYW